MNMIRTYLLKHRKQKKKSLHTMAEALGVSRNYYNLLEKGVNDNIELSKNAG